jgi:hypothetical protein
MTTMSQTVKQCSLLYGKKKRLTSNFDFGIVGKKIERGL